MARPLHPADQQQAAQASQVSTAEVPGSAGAIGVVRSFGFQAIAVLLGIALAFM